MATQENKTKEDAAVQEVVKNPGRDDVHEQRQEDQPKEGAVTQTPSPAPKNEPPTKGG